MLSIIKNKKGFTLIELLVVIAILSILLVIVLVAINPAKQTRDARHSKRRADVLTILNGVNQFFVDSNTGSFPSGTPAEGAPAVAISEAGTGLAFCTDLVPTFIAALPADPSSGNDSVSCSAGYDTKYTIERTSGDRITITAPEALNDGATATISATR